MRYIIQPLTLTLMVQVKRSVRQSGHKLALFNVSSLTLWGPKDARVVRVH